MTSSPSQFAYYGGGVIAPEPPLVKNVKDTTSQLGNWNNNLGGSKLYLPGELLKLFPHITGKLNSPSF